MKGKTIDLKLSVAYPTEVGLVSELLATLGVNIGVVCGEGAVVGALIAAHQLHGVGLAQTSVVQPDLRTRQVVHQPMVLARETQV